MRHKETFFQRRKRREKSLVVNAAPLKAFYSRNSPHQTPAVWVSLSEYYSPKIISFSGWFEFFCHQAFVGVYYKTFKDILLPFEPPKKCTFSEKIYQEPGLILRPWCMSQKKSLQKSVCKSHNKSQLHKKILMEEWVLQTPIGTIGFVKLTSNKTHQIGRCKILTVSNGVTRPLLRR